MPILLSLAEICDPEYTYNIYGTLCGLPRLLLPDTYLIIAQSKYTPYDITM